MKSFEIAVNTNVNGKKIAKTLFDLTSIGCKISNQNANFLVEYDDELENQVKKIFDENYES